MEEYKPSRIQKLKDYMNECRRVLKITKKPDKEEFKAIVKVSTLGMAVIGFIGFFLHIMKELFVK